VEVSECEDGVVDDGGTVDFGWTKTEGADTGVGRAGGAGEWKTTVEDEEGGRGEQIKEVSATASGESGRLW
jgi:hypothetical protein